jgi:tetratricopeptide (TPR) repeat protein
MPRLESTEILHVATTDHRIPRHGDRADRATRSAARPRGAGEPLVNFHRDLMDHRERAAAGRDIGVALCREGAAGAAMALPLLEAALTARPHDVLARESLGFALGQLNRPDEGLAAFRTALARDPTRELTWVGAAYLAAQAGRLAEATADWQRALAISPCRADYRAELALVAFRDHDWNRAAATCREALRLDPANVEVRKLLVQCEIRLGDLKAARSQFEILMGFDPPDRDALRRWFAPQRRPGPPAP